MSWFTRFAIEAIYPPTDDLPGVAETDLAGFLADLHANAPPLMRVGLWLATVVFTTQNRGSLGPWARSQPRRPS